MFLITTQPTFNYNLAEVRFSIKGQAKVKIVVPNPVVYESSIQMKIYETHGNCYICCIYFSENLGAARGWIDYYIKFSQSLLLDAAPTITNS